MSTRIVLIVGICSDVLFALLFYISNGSPSPLLSIPLVATLVCGLVGTFVGAGMWARNASTVVAGVVVAGIIAGTLIFGEFATFGFDDPKVLIIPISFLLAASVTIGHTTKKRLH